jgi:hypothetical protein
VQPCAGYTGHSFERSSLALTWIICNPTLHALTGVRATKDKSSRHSCLISEYSTYRLDLAQIRAPFAQHHQRCRQYKRPRPCQATLTTIMMATTIMVIIVMTLPYAKYHTFGIQRYTCRIIRQIVSFFGQVSSAERSLNKEAALVEAWIC